MKFVLDETEWISDPLNGQSSPDGFGGSNSVLNISCGGSTVDPGNGDSTGGTVSACGDPTVFQWEDSVMYFVMVDRFYDSDNYVDLVDGVAVRMLQMAQVDNMSAAISLVLKQSFRT